MPRRGRGELLIAGLLGFACARPLPDPEGWLRAQVPAGATIIAEGALAEALVGHARVRSVTSIAALPDQELAAVELLLLDSRVYGPEVRRGSGTGDVYRRIARDPMLEVVGLLESESSGRGAKLLLLRRAPSAEVELGASALPLECDGARWVGGWLEPGFWSLLKLRFAGAAPSALWLDGEPIALSPEPDGHASAAIGLAAGEHRIELESIEPPRLELVRVLSRRSFAGNERIEAQADLVRLDR